MPDYSKFTIEELKQDRDSALVRLGREQKEVDLLNHLIEEREKRESPKHVQPAA